MIFLGTTLLRGGGGCRGGRRVLWGAGGAGRQSTVTSKLRRAENSYNPFCSSVYTEQR